MPILEDLEKRKQELETTLQSLHEFIKQRNAKLANVERLSFNKVIAKKRTLLNLSSKGSNVNYLIRSSKSDDLEMKYYRRCMFYLQSRKRFLTKSLTEIIERIDNLQGTNDDFVPKENA